MQELFLMTLWEQLPIPSRAQKAFEAVALGGGDVQNISVWLVDFFAKVLPLRALFIRADCNCRQKALSDRAKGTGWGAFFV